MSNSNLSTGNLESGYEDSKKEPPEGNWWGDSAMEEDYEEWPTCPTFRLCSGSCLSCPEASGGIPLERDYQSQGLRIVGEEDSIAGDCWGRLV